MEIDGNWLKTESTKNENQQNRHTNHKEESMALLIGFVDGNMAGTMQGMRTCPSAAHNIWYASLSVFTLAYNL